MELSVQKKKVVAIRAVGTYKFAQILFPLLFY